MRRDEQIVEASWRYAKAYQKPFVDGAMWADNNPNWISVEDELPEEGDMVLVALKNRIMTITTTSYCVDGEWYDYGNKIHGGVTHWMPLPNPPKKGGEEI